MLGLALKGIFIYIIIWAALENFLPEDDRLSSFITFLLRTEKERKKANFEKLKKRVEEELSKKAKS